jgi:hypothetical protein
MKPYACPECEAIRADIQRLMEHARRNKPEPGTRIEELIRRFEELRADDDVQAGVRTTYSEVLRRILAHQKLTHQMVIPPSTRRPELSNN